MSIALKALLLVGLPITVLAFMSLSAPKDADALIHEIIGAACREGGEDVEPPGQAGESNGNSFVRALIASKFITSIDDSVPGQITVNFDPDKPNSKFISAGFDLTIPDGFGPGVDLILSPFVIPDPDFPAHANCKNLNP